MILIFTEAFQSTGLGHFSRCSALAEILHEANYEIAMILHTNNMRLISSPLFPIRNLDWKQSMSLAEIFAGQKVFASFVDSYSAPPEIYEEIRLNSDRLICIDDANRILYPLGSYILNPGFGGALIGYDSQRYTIFTGGEYALVRKPFRESFEIPSIRGKIESVLISVGGNDHLNVIPMIVALLEKEHPSWRKNIIVTSAFQNLGIIEALSNDNVVLYRDLSAMQMREIMLDTDVAITAGGQTIYELAHCGVPMILLETAENQHGNIIGLAQRGAAINVGKVQDSGFLEKLSRALATIISRIARSTYRHQLFTTKKEFNQNKWILGILT